MKKSEILRELRAIQILLGKNVVDAWEGDLEQTKSVAILEEFEGNKYNGWAERLDKLVKKLSGKPARKDEGQRFARKCSVTGKGMNEGFCFGDGEDYAIDEKSALVIAKKYGYKTLAQAYKDEAYYFTEWEKGDYQYIMKNGKLVEEWE